MINWTVLEAILYRQKTVNEPIDASWIGHVPPEHWPCIAIIYNKTNKNIGFPSLQLTYDRKMYWSIIKLNKENSSSEKWQNIFDDYFLSFHDPMQIKKQ